MTCYRGQHTGRTSGTEVQWALGIGWLPHPQVKTVGSGELLGSPLPIDSLSGAPGDRYPHEAQVSMSTTPMLLGPQ